MIWSLYALFLSILNKYVNITDTILGLSLS